MTVDAGLGGTVSVVLAKPPRSRLVLGLIAALLVNGGLLLFLQRDRPVNNPASRALIALRILPSEPIPERPRQLRPAEAAARRPVAIAVPATEVNVIAPAIAPPVTTRVAEPVPVTTPGPAKPEPLKLALPAGRPASGPRTESMLSQMLNDPRSNTPKVSVEYAVADAAGTLPITVSDSTDGTGHKIVRQGSKCTRVAAPRVGMLNPMDKSAQGFAGMAGSCFTK